MLNCPHCEQNLTPHEIGVLHAAVGRTQSNTSTRYWGAKLTTQDVNRIRKSKRTIWKLVEKYNVSFATISRIKNNVTYKAQNELKCPHCKHKLTAKEIGRLFGTLGGSTSSLKKAKTSATNGRKVAKLTEKDVANIRKSNASTKELVKKYKVSNSTITEIRRYERWKPIQSE